MENKHWYQSKTLWVNAIALVAIVVQIVTGSKVVIDPDGQVLILAFINLILRLATNQGLTT